MPRLIEKPKLAAHHRGLLVAELLRADVPPVVVPGYLDESAISKKMKKLKIFFADPSLSILTGIGRGS